MRTKFFSRREVNVREANVREVNVIAPIHPTCSGSGFLNGFVKSVLTMEALMASKPVYNLLKPTNGLIGAGGKSGRDITGAGV